MPTPPDAAKAPPLDDTTVYTLDDLKSWEKFRPGLPPSLAVLGHPVAHSVSPQMHNAALAELAKNGRSGLSEWRYFKFDILPELLAEALPLLHLKKFVGVNLTIPHKILAVSLVNEVVGDAKIVGAVNTLFATKNGWIGNNTDTVGLTQAIVNDLGITSPVRDVVILGAGGAARSAAIQCLRNGCLNMWIGARDLEKVGEFIIELKSQDVAKDAVLTGFALANPPHGLPYEVLVINTTSLGLKLSDPAPIDVSILPDDARVLDMVYRSEGATALVANARRRELRAADGLGMLVAQGARSLEIWIDDGTNPRAPFETMLLAARKALGQPHRDV